MTLRVGLIGAGGVGRKRAAAVSQNARTQLTMVCDCDPQRAGAVAASIGASHVTEWQAVLEGDQAHLIIVSTPHDMLTPITVAALRAGKHVLCEKPLGRTATEAREAVAAADETGRILHAGYNHRFHPAIRAAQEAAAEGKLGDLMHLRGRYGHGGRPGYEKEWRADAAISGGGELLDQGAHLIDLSMWFLGDLARVNGQVRTSFWDMAPVEDNASALLSTASGQTANLHVSWTQWRNLFSLEVFGCDGYALVDGLGGSYGEQRLTLGRRRPQGGTPDETRSVFQGPDRSWGDEWDAFLRAIDGHDTGAADGAAAIRTLDCVDAIYRSAANDGAPQDIDGSSESA